MDWHDVCRRSKSRHSNDKVNSRHRSRRLSVHNSSVTHMILHVGVWTSFIIDNLKPASIAASNMTNDMHQH